MPKTLIAALLFYFLVGCSTPSFDMSEAKYLAEFDKQVELIGEFRKAEKQTNTLFKKDGAHYGIENGRIMVFAKGEKNQLIKVEYIGELGELGSVILAATGVIEKTGNPATLIEKFAQSNGEPVLEHLGKATLYLEKTGNIYNFTITPNT